MADSPSGGPPEYKVYKSRRNPLSGLGSGGLDGLRKRGRDKGPKKPRERGPVTPGRVLKCLALGVVAWLLFALLLFLVSAQLNGGLSARSEDALSGGGSLLTGSNILVLGTDTRAGDSHRQEPERPRPRRHAHDPAHQPGRHAARSRSRATPRPRSPATARRRSTPPTRSAAAR